MNKMEERLKYFVDGHYGADILVKNGVCICNYCGKEFSNPYDKVPVLNEEIGFGKGYFDCMKHIKTKHKELLEHFKLVQCDEVDVIMSCRDGYDEIISFEKYKSPRQEKDKPDEPEPSLIRYNLNLGRDKLLEHIMKLHEDKHIPIEDIVIGRNKKGNYTLHFYEQC